MYIYIMLQFQVQSCVYPVRPTLCVFQGKGGTVRIGRFTAMQPMQVWAAGGAPVMPQGTAQLNKVARASCMNWTRIPMMKLARATGSIGAAVTAAAVGASVAVAVRVLVPVPRRASALTARTATRAKMNTALCFCIFFLFGDGCFWSLVFLIFLSSLCSRCVSDRKLLCFYTDLRQEWR